jgi:hypothetical protein
MLEALLRAVTPRSGAPAGDHVPSVEAPMVTSPSAPLHEVAIVSSARPVSLEAPAHWAQEAAPKEVPRDRPSNRRAGLESTLSSEAPKEILDALRSAPPAPPPTKLGGTMRSAIDHAELDVNVSRRLAQARPWRDPRVIAAFALGFICGMVLGLLLVRIGNR